MDKGVAANALAPSRVLVQWLQWIKTLAPCLAHPFAVVRWKAPVLVGACHHELPACRSASNAVPSYCCYFTPLSPPK